MTQSIAAELARVPMSPTLQATLTRAADYARDQGHGRVTLEHLLLALAEDADATLVLQASSVALDRLGADVSTHLSGLEPGPGINGSEAMGLAPELKRVLEAAAAAAQQGRRQVNGAIVLAAIVGEGKSTAAHILRAQGLTFEHAIKALQRSSRAPQPAQPTARPNTAPPQQRTAPAPRAPTPQVSAPPAVEVSPPPTLASPVQAQPPPVPRPPAEPDVRTEQAAPAGYQPPPATSRVSVQVSPQQAAPASHARVAEPQLQPTPQMAPAWEPAGLEPHAIAAPTVQTARPATQPPPMPPRIAEPPPPPPPPPPPTKPPQPPEEPQLRAAEPAPAPQPQRRYEQPPPAAWPAYEAQPASSGYAPPLPEPQVHAQQQQVPWPVPQSEPRAPVPYDAPPVPRQRVPRSLPPADLSTGQLIENIPRVMRVDVPVTVEVRLVAGDDHSPGSLEGLTRAMTVRLSSPSGDFSVETLAPETQWIEADAVSAGQALARWRWTVMPLGRGRERLQIAVSTRWIGPDGLSQEMPLPVQQVTVSARRNWGQLFMRLLGWITAMAIGGGLALVGTTFAGPLIAVVSGLLGFR